MLTPLQQRLTQILSVLPEAEDFALAGGAALIVRGLIERPTRDLDYFATVPQAVERLLPALQQALAGEGIEVNIIRHNPGFVRLEVSDGSDVCEIDLSHDSRMQTAEPTPEGLVLSLDELAADKMLALFGRAEARDFHDVDRLIDRVGQQRLLDLAAAKDPGFTAKRFAESLLAIDRLQPEDFPGGNATRDRLANRFRSWAGELTRSRGDDEQRAPGRRR